MKIAKDVAFSARVFERYRLLQKGMTRGWIKPEIQMGV